MWELRKGFWNRLATSKLRSNKPADIPVPRDGGRKLRAVGLQSQYPGIPVPNIRVADHVRTHVQPARVYADGRREPLDVYQRLVNANFNLNVSRTRLMHDFGYLALDRRGAAAFRLFRYDMQKLHERMERDPPAPWKIYPRILEANINA